VWLKTHVYSSSQCGEVGSGLKHARKLRCFSECEKGGLLSIEIG